jgi:hypothetical protein
MTEHLMNKTLEVLDRLESGQEGSTANHLAIRYSIPRRMDAGTNYLEDQLREAKIDSRSFRLICSTRR